MYYQGILAAKPSSQNLEEFLVAAGRKEQIHFTISETDCRFDALTESQQQKIEIKKERMGIFGTCHHLRCRVCTAGTDADYFGGFSGGVRLS